MPLYIPSGATFPLAVGDAVSWSTDLFLYRDAANTLAQRNGTTGQQLNIYATYTDASNRRYIRIDNNSVGLVGAGTGINNADFFLGNYAGSGQIGFLTNGSVKWNINGSGHFLANVDNTYDIGASGATRPRNIFTAGAINIGSVGLYFAAQGGVSASSNGVFQLQDAAGTSFGRLQFGGTTSSFPALKRSATILQAVLADDSGFAPLQGLLRTAVNAVTGLTAGVLSATTNASIVITDASGQAYRVPCII